METIVFTNGCFDILHPGHIDLLKQARNLGTKLIVGINSDRSVREIKGSTRPLLNQESRAAILRELRSVDEVRVFDENTPERIIKEIKPHILVKGGDWKPEEIIGANFVLENGGRVFSIPFKQNISTSQIIEKMQSGDISLNPKPNSLTVNASDNLSESSLSDFPGVFQVSNAQTIQRGAELIANVLAKKNKICVAGFPSDWLGCRRISEDFERYFGKENILLSDNLAEIENNLRAGNLLVSVGGFEDREDFANVLMKAVQNDVRTILLIGKNHRKQAALSDVCVMSEAKSPDELVWQQTFIGYLWSLAVGWRK